MGSIQTMLMEKSECKQRSTCSPYVRGPSRLQPTFCNSLHDMVLSRNSGYLLGDPQVRIIVCWGLYGGPLFRENYHIAFGVHVPILYEQVYYVHSDPVVYRQKPLTLRTLRILNQNGGAAAFFGKLRAESFRDWNSMKRGQGETASQVQVSD